MSGLVMTYLDGSSILSDDWPRYVKLPIPIKATQMFAPFEVETLEGTMRGKALDYLIEDIKGERYPCDREVFEESYKRQ